MYSQAKGFHREVESEESWRQNSGLTNRNHIKRLYDVQLWMDPSSIIYINSRIPSGYRIIFLCVGGDGQTEPLYFRGFERLVEDNPIYKDMLLIEIELCARRLKMEKSFLTLFFRTTNNVR